MVTDKHVRCQVGHAKLAMLTFSGLARCRRWRSDTMLRRGYTMMTQPTDSQPAVVIAIRHAARIYGVPYMTLINWIKVGKLRELWDGDTRVALVSELEALVRERAEELARLASLRPQAQDILGPFVRADQRADQDSAEGSS